MQPVIEVSHLSHRYGNRPALDDVSFEVRAGEVFGLLGPNGAGKTTTIRLINGLFEPSAGKLRVLGMDPVTQGEAVRHKTGVLTETPALYERLTARQNLQFFATVSGVPADQSKARAQQLLEYFELTDRADDRAGTFSKGMKQRLALARALIHNPELVFLDEPTAALDPEAALQVRDWIATISRREGNTVILCTHILSEAERLCDRVAVMGPGRLLAVGTLDELRHRVAPGLWLHVELWQPCALRRAALAQIPGVLSIEAVDGQPVRSLRVQIAGEDVVPQVAAEVVAQGGQLFRLQPDQISLEEVYFRLQDSQHKAGAK
ncbi:MAG TPA: ABC transporter ATP-binding protein [Anaerolineaceae bacterium]|nr:ABC transporter ATP-binding protein [Anaerolineaceae bacterium]